MPNWTRLAQASLFASTVFLVACSSSSDVEVMPSKNFSYRVKSLVMHFTAVNYQESVDALVKEGNVSSHYLIPKADDPSYPYDEPKVFQLVDENQRAWHAGISYWQGRSGLNDHSIGIEIVNMPFCQEDNPVDASPKAAVPEIMGAEKNRDLCVFPEFEEKQIQLLIRLSKEILARNPDIEPTAVIGHSDIAPARKNDPGPKFPWYRLYQEGIGAWYDNESLTHHWLTFNQTSPSLGLVQKALGIYGYDIAVTGRMDQQTIDTLSAFQMHFVPWQVSGELNNQTAAAVFALLEKYFPTSYSQLHKLYQSEVLSAQLSQQQMTESVQHYQLSRLFQEPTHQAQSEADNRDQFMAYQGRGELIIETDNARSANIFINGQKLGLDEFEQFQANTVSIHKRTIDGLNSLRVESIQPQGASIKISIPYPRLVLDVQHYVPLFQQVDRFIDDKVKNGFPGASLAVVHKGKIVKRSSYGYAIKYAANGELLKQRELMTPEHMFDLSSNTQVFATNLAVMQLVNAGKIDLYQTLQYYIPEYRGNGREVIRVKDLLAQASGYADAVEFYRPDNQYGEYFYSQNKAKTSRLLLTAVPFESIPGRTQQYSETNYMLLGLLVERASGIRLDEYSREKIYAPLGLKHTLFSPLKAGFTADRFAATEIFGNTQFGKVDYPNVRKAVLQGEVADENAFYSMQGVSGHAGLFSNIDDLAILSQAMLNRGGYGDVKLFSQATMSRFLSPAGQSNSIGLGWQLASDSADKAFFSSYASGSAFGHQDSAGTLVVIDPAYDLAIVLLTNKQHSTFDLVEDDLASAANNFETGKFGSIVSMIYEALIEFEAQNQLQNRN
jgi:N-acetylmuramoyl-L-alanine amidase